MLARNRRGSGPIGATVVRNLLTGQYNAPVRIVTFNVDGGLVARRVGRDRKPDSYQIRTNHYGGHSSPNGRISSIVHGSGRPEQLPFPLRRTA